jgi:hypothetical protein
LIATSIVLLGLERCPSYRQYFSLAQISYSRDAYMNLKHNWSEICMPPRFHTNDKTIIVDNFNTLKQKFERHLNHEPMSIEEVQRLLLEQDIPIEIAKELAVIILRDCFSAAAATIHL